MLSTLNSEFYSFHVSHIPSLHFERHTIRHLNEAYRKWMRHIYPLYPKLKEERQQKIDFTRSLVESLRRDNISCFKLVSGTGQLVELTDNELRKKLAQAFREKNKWISKPFGGDTNHVPSFRNFFLQMDEDDGALPDVEPIVLDGPPITPNEIQEMHEKFKGE